jgi:homoprotocatechuate degradation regulator HpaR
MNDFSQSLPLMLYRALDVVMPEFRKIFAEHGLTEQQWRILRVLWEKDEQPLMVVAEKTLLPSPSLVGIVDRLERDGLVTRRRSQADRRVVYVVLTTAGARLEEAVSPAVDAAYAGLIKRMGSRKWHVLLSSLNALVASATASEAKKTAKTTAN